MKRVFRVSLFILLAEICFFGCSNGSENSNELLLMNAVLNSNDKVYSGLDESFLAKQNPLNYDNGSVDSRISDVPDVLNVPTNFNAVAFNGSVGLFWDKPEVNRVYILTYGKEYDFESSKISVVCDDSGDETVKYKQYKMIDGLENGVSYKFVLVFNNGQISEEAVAFATPAEIIDGVAMIKAPGKIQTGSVAFHMMTAESWEYIKKNNVELKAVGDHYGHLTDSNIKMFWNDAWGGSNTDGGLIFPGIYGYVNFNGNKVLADNLCYPEDAACEELSLEKKTDAVSKLVVKYSSVVRNNLRKGESVRWVKILRDGYRWHIYGYLCNEAFEKSLAAEDKVVQEWAEGSEPVMFDTVADLEACKTIFYNSTKDSYNGVIVKTRGYYSVGDGGGATYVTVPRETYVNKRARKHYYKYFDHRSGSGQIMAYKLGNISCDVDGDGIAEDVLGINMKQLGAGRCVQITEANYSEKASFADNNDVDRFNDAMNMLYDWFDENRDYVTVYFPAGEYRMGCTMGPVGEKIRIIGDTDILKADKTGIDDSKIARSSDSSGWENGAKAKGKRSVIYSDNGGSYSEMMFSIWDCSDFYMRGISLEARETKRLGNTTERQLCITGDVQRNTDESKSVQNVTIEGCEVYVDENCHASDGNLDRQYTNVTIYSGMKGVNLRNNIFCNMSGVERGACYGIFDFWGNGNKDSEIGGTEDILLEGNLMYHNCHDESGGIFTTGWPRNLKPNCYVHRVTIRGNEMHPMSSNASSRTMCFTMSYGVSFNIQNIMFEKNHVIADFPSKLMTFGSFDVKSNEENSDFVDEDGKAYGCVVRNNVFEIRQHGANSYVFEANKYAWIHDNTVNILEGSSAGSIFQGGATYENNIVKSVGANCSAGGIAYMAGKLKNNTVMFEGSLGCLTSQTMNVTGNTFTVAKPMKTWFGVADASNGDVNILNNIVNYNILETEDYGYGKEPGEYFHQGWNCTHVMSIGRYGNKENSYPKYTISFIGNKINAPNASKLNKHVLYGKFNAWDSNGYVIKDNKLGQFSYVRSQMGALPSGGIEYSGNTDENGVLLEFSTEKDNYKNYISGQYEVGRE